MFDNSYLKLARNESPRNPNGSSTSNSAALLDPSHPATKLKPQALPLWQANGIKVKLVPMALLQKPLSQCSGKDPFARNFVPWAERIRHAKKAGMKDVSTDLVGAGEKKKLARRIPMSYLTATSKERMGNKTHMRRRITTRIKTALNLIVTRGAYEDQSNIQIPRLKFDNEEASIMGERWIMQGMVYRCNDSTNLKCHSTHLGWSYIFYPTTEIYNMSYPKLVTLLRQGLKSLYNNASELERRWLKEALLSEPRPRLASGVVEKPQNSKPDDVHRVESPMTADHDDLLDARLLSGLAIIKERLGKRICLSSRRYSAFQRSIFVCRFLSNTHFFFIVFLRIQPTVSSRNQVQTVSIGWKALRLLNLNFGNRSYCQDLL